MIYFSLKCKLTFRFRWMMGRLDEMWEVHMKVLKMLSVKFHMNGCTGAVFFFRINLNRPESKSISRDSGFCKIFSGRVWVGFEGRSVFRLAGFKNLIGLGSVRVGCRKKVDPLISSVHNSK